ncbi:kinetochore scaffold 1 [Scyliorhinus canicula]|uniref:kinetochore scaffold 1 n=1 Tax=Scyliorhinus canicula TaxID=7830 RepID=UPI0018F71E8A|nr:kinetochore scaffold 1 [Scyliorhinus canicula]XP_038639489.1 kinetochore scaffold 1 [Scyliorhinus canicula]
MDENCPAFPEANVENRDGKCKRRQSGILKISRSPLRTLKEADVSQKIEQVGKLRRSSRRVSFAETKEVKEFVTDKMMMIIQDVENGIDSQKENQLNELERDMMSLTTNFSIAGMDSLLHAPLRTPLQQFETCDHIETVSKHQIFPDSGIQMRSEDAVQSSETKVTSRLPKKIDFKSFLTGFDSTEPTYSNVCFDTGEESGNKSFSFIRQNEVPKPQKTIDFQTFLNSIKHSDTDENNMVSMSSIFEEPAMKQTDFGITSTCNMVDDIEITNDTLLQINSNKNLDPNRTVLFLDQDNDMEFTRSHTIAINHFAMGNTATPHSSTVPKNVETLGTEGPTHSPFLQDKTIVFSGGEYMDMTRSHTVPIDVRKVEHLTHQNRLTAVTNQKNDKSILPSTPNEHKIFSDNGYCSKINQNVTLGTSKLTSSSVSILSSFPSDKAITFSEANGVDITKGQVITIDNGSLGQGRNEATVSNKMTRLSNAGSVQSFFPCDETMMFSEANDMDRTKSHTITIDSESFGKVTNEALSSTRIIPRLTEVDCSLLSFPRDKTIMFSEANDMDITKSHTVTIDSGNLGEVTNKTLASMKLTSRWSTVGSILSSFPTEKTMVFSESNDMDITKSHTVAIDSGKLGLIVNETSSSTRMTPRLTAAGCPPLSFPSDKTMVFSAANDMDITKGHTVPIDIGNPGQVRNEAMGFTRMPHKLDVPGSIRSFHNDKTMKLSEANDIDITKSHAATIESGNLRQVTNETCASPKQASFGTTVGCIPSSFPTDKTMLFSEANDMDVTENRTVPIHSGNPGQVRNEAMGFIRMPHKLDLPGSIRSFHSDKMMLSEANDMDISKSHIIPIDRGNLNSVVSWTMGSRMPFPNGKTTVFSEADDLDITKSHTVAMESGNIRSVANHSMNLDKKASIVNTVGSVPSSFPSDKTPVFTEANDMDITKSHTVPIESGNLKSAANHNAGLNKMISRQSIFRSIQPSFPSGNTMVFSEANDMDMTRSHTVAIESGNLGLGINKMKGSMKLSSIGSTAGLILSSFPSDETRAFSEANDRGRGKSHTVVSDSGNLGQVTNETFSLMKPTSTKNTLGSIMSSFPSEKTMVFSESNDMDFTKSHVIAIGSENLRLVKNHTMGSSKKASIENTAGSILSSFPSDKTMVFSEANDMDITKSHTVAIESGNVRPDANHTMDSSKMTTRRSTARSTLSSFPGDKTVVFSEANDMDMTNSHTVPIDSDCHGKVTNEAFGRSGMIPRLTDAGCSLLSIPSDKTMVFSEANDMDINKSHTVPIDGGNLGQVRNETFGLMQLTSTKNTVGSIMSSFPREKTMVFSEANDMDITKSHTVAIESGNDGRDANHTMDSSKITSRRNTARSALSSFPGYKTVVFSEANNMDVTKSHTVPIDGESLRKVTNEALGSTGIIPRLTDADCSLLSCPRDKTMVFSEANDMDITKSHMFAIESGNVRPDANHTMDSSKMTTRRGTARSTLSSFAGDKTVVFSEANDMDLTKSHTVPIDSGNLGHVRNETFSLMQTSTKNTVGSIMSSFPREKTMVFSEANDVDITKSHTVAIESVNDRPDANDTMDSSKITSRRNTARSALSSFPGDKTVVFSEANDMDMTKSHTVPIDSGNLGHVRNETFSLMQTSTKNTVGSIMSSFPSEKTMVFSEANDMDITKSHTVAIESGNDRPDANHTMDSSKITSRRHTARLALSSLPGNKTVLFSEANDMDITKSHTVPIDSEGLGKVTNEAFSSSGMIPRETDAGGSPLSFPRDKTMVFSEANDMDITKSHTVAIESGNGRPDANPTMDSNKITSRRNTARSTLSSFPGYKTVVFSEAHDMDGIKSHTVAIESGSLESTTNESLASDKVDSRFNAPGSVLSFLPNDEFQVSEQVTAVTKIDTVPIHNKHDISSNYNVLQLVLEKGKNCFDNRSDNVEFANFQNTVQNTISNVSCVVHTRSPDSDSFTGHVESTILNVGSGTEQEGEPVRSTRVTEVHEKLNGKGIKKYGLCATNSLDSNLMYSNDNAQETRSVDDQSTEAATEEFVRHKVSDAQSEGTANSAIAESISTASKSLGHNQSRKSCLANMPSLQKLNSITNVTYGIPVGESGHANWKTWDTKTRFSKQSSLVRDMFKYKISLGIFPPKLPNRENLYEAVNSNQQDATETSEELCSSLLQNVTYKSNKLEGDSNIFKPNVGPEINSVIQIESQIADHDQVENTRFDTTEPSHRLKSNDVPCLLIPEQFRKGASPESHESVTGPDQFLGGSVMIKSVEQRLYQKRAWTEEEENDNVCSKRKMRNLGPKDIDSSRQKATGARVVQWEGVENKIMEENLLSMMTKSLNSTSSLDSTKGDGTSAIAITPKCNLNTSLVIIEESELHEKLMDGQITVREFFKLLKVQTHAQKSRQSELQVNVELDKSSAFENWLAVKFIHRPKREVYEEDSSALFAAIAELKEQLLDLDKLLSEVNLPLWKGVMQMTEEELQQFRSCLNAKKTTFVKRTKVICHEQKVKLYSAQLNMLKEQRKLRNEYENSLDDMLHKMDDCLASLDLANLDHLGECCADVIDNDESMKQLEQTVTNGREELKKLQEEHRDMESQLAKVLAEKELKEKAANLCNLKEEFQELLEWTLFLYQDEQAVYQFLYESLELTLKFGEPENAGGVVSLGQKCRKILDFNLESVLDEDEAPLHSKFVHDLIMTYWKSQGSWHNVYTNESQLPMLLLDMSLVVSRYRLLGDELEYFLNWGSKFGILKTEIQPMGVKYLFTSYDALSKFELTFHLKPSYPWGPLQFTFNSWFGNISGEHINEVLLTVKPGPKYLTRIVKSLFLMLLIIPGALRFR